MRKYCCKQMEVALTYGYSWARQIEEDEEGNLYIWTYATDQEPYKEKKVKVKYCPFCGHQLDKPGPISRQDWKKMYEASH